MLGECISSQVTTNVQYFESLLTNLFSFPRIDAAYFHNNLQVYTYVIGGML